MPYYDGISNKVNKKLSDALGYVDPTKGWAVTINPNKWFGDPAYGEENGQFANGIMTGQMTYRTDGDSGKLCSDKNCPKAFPLLIWFDENF